MSFMYQALLIDDSKPISFFNKIILERSTWFSTVEVAKNGQDALTLLNTGFSPDIIFLDLNMPVMNGWDFLKMYTQKNIILCPIVLLLGTDLSDIDKREMKKYPIIKGVKAKMLSKEIVIELKNNILES